jgi:hypothetical protein
MRCGDILFNLSFGKLEAGAKGSSSNEQGRQQQNSAQRTYAEAAGANAAATKTLEATAQPVKP